MIKKMMYNIQMSTPPSRLSIISDIFIISLAIISGVLIIIEETFELSAAQIRYLDIADVTIAYIFLIEFFTLLYISSDRKRFIKRRWWEILAAIPFTNPVTESLRLLRLFRIARVLRVGTHLEIANRDIFHKEKNTTS